MKINYNIKLYLKVKCLSLGRDIITEILGDQVQFITFKNIIKWAFEKNTLIAKLTKIQIEKLCDSAKFINKKAEDIIYAKGSLLSQKIIIVLEGSLKKVSFTTILLIIYVNSLSSTLLL